MKMGDLELSLDDIIKKKLKKTGVPRGRNNAGKLKKPIRKISDPNNRITKNQNVSVAAKKGSRMASAKNTWGPTPAAAIGDARLKIIHKQRHKMIDAREKLGQIAKQTDARLRLVKLRERQRAVLSRGRISTPGRPLFEHPLLQRTVPRLYDEDVMDYANDIAYPKRSYTDRVVLDNMFSFGYKGRPEAPVLFRTVENDIPLNRLYEPEKNMYSWTKSVHVADDISDIPVNRTREEIKGNMSWDMDDTPIVITKKVKPQETVGILKRSAGNGYDRQAVTIIKESPPPTKMKPTTRTLNERFCQKGNLLAQKISLLKAKLDASQKNNKNSSPETQQHVGHRIVVSNLVPSVTHEDVKELFEDIGELISSKVVRPGTAEVVYKLHKDAVKAVDVYHNRQLDGQPMKCLLVNNRSNFPVTSKTLKGAERKIGKPIVELDMTAFRKALHKKSTS